MAQYNIGIDSEKVKGLLVHYNTLKELIHEILNQLPEARRVKRWELRNTIAVSKPHHAILFEHGSHEARFITLLNCPDERIFTRVIDQEASGSDCSSLV